MPERIDSVVSPGNVICSSATQKADFDGSREYYLASKLKQPSACSFRTIRHSVRVSFSRKGRSWLTITRPHWAIRQRRLPFNGWQIPMWLVGLSMMIICGFAGPCPSASISLRVSPGLGSLLSISQCGRDPRRLTIVIRCPNGSCGRPRTRAGYHDTAPHQSPEVHA